jgi:hypothetical protein
MARSKKRMMPPIRKNPPGGVQWVSAERGGNGRAEEKGTYRLCRKLRRLL